jgi:hypothetical protein
MPLPRARDDEDDDDDVLQQNYARTKRRIAQLEEELETLKTAGKKQKSCAYSTFSPPSPPPTKTARELFG